MGSKVQTEAMQWVTSIKKKYIKKIEAVICQKLLVNLKMFFSIYFTFLYKKLNFFFKIGK